MSSSPSRRVSKRPCLVPGRFAFWGARRAEPYIRHMATCLNCDETFDLAGQKSEYEEYSESYEHDGYSEDLCVECLLPGLSSDYNRGLAIMMMSGDADYDEKHVEDWL